MTDYWAFKDFPLFIFSLIGIVIVSLAMYGVRNSEDN